MQLSEAKHKFDALGINVAAVSYDSVESNNLFAAESKISFALLSDVDAGNVSRYGILNDSYPPGHFAHGVPHPGIFLINSDGIVVMKFAEEDYRERPSLNLVLEAAAGMVQNTAE